MPEQEDHFVQEADTAHVRKYSPRIHNEILISAPYVDDRMRFSGRRTSSRWFSQCSQSILEKIDPSGPRAKPQLLTIFRSMIDGASKPDNQASLIRQVSEWVKNEPFCKPVVRDSGGLALIIHIMAINCSNEADIQVAGCETLASVSEDVVETQEAIGALEAVDAVLDAIKSHQFSADVQTSAARAFRALAWGIGNRQKMIRYGALQDLVIAMRNHPTNATLQEHVASTIAQVVYGSPESKALVGNTGGIQSILLAMKSHPKNTSLQAQCCFALRNLSWESPDNHALMHEHGADALLISALENFSRVPGLQDQALAALGNLMFHDEQTFRLTVESRDSQGLHNALFSALKTFPFHVSITSNALNLLINTCELSKIDHMKHLRRIAVTPDVVKLICKSIQDPSSRSLDSVLQVATLVISLSVVVEFQNSLRTNKVIELLLTCLKQFVPKAPAQCDMILDALNSALSGNDESKKLFNQIGGVAALAELMTEAYSTEVIQEKACMVLDNVSNGQFEATAEKMNNRKEAMKSVLASMISFPNNAKLQEYGCSVMIKVAGTSHQDAGQLMDMGANPVVEKARVVHKGKPAVESLVNQLLTLLVPSDSSRTARGQTGRGNASARLRSRSRTIEKGTRSRSSMGRSKSPVKKRGTVLESVDESPNAFEEDDEEVVEAPKSTGSRNEHAKYSGSTSQAAPRGQQSSTKREIDDSDNASTTTRISSKGGSSSPGDHRKIRPSAKQQLLENTDKCSRSSHVEFENGREKCPGDNEQYRLGGIAKEGEKLEDPITEIGTDDLNSRAKSRDQSRGDKEAMPQQLIQEPRSARGRGNGRVRSRDHDSTSVCQAAPAVPEKTDGRTTLVPSDVVQSRVQATENRQEDAETGSRNVTSLCDQRNSRRGPSRDKTETLRLTIPSEDINRVAVADGIGVKPEECLGQVPRKGEENIINEQEYAGENI